METRDSGSTPDATTPPSPNKKNCACSRRADPLACCGCLCWQAVGWDKHTARQRAASIFIHSPTGYPSTAAPGFKAPTSENNKKSRGRFCHASSGQCRGGLCFFGGGLRPNRKVSATNHAELDRHSQDRPALASTLHPIQRTLFRSAWCL